MRVRRFSLSRVLFIDAESVGLTIVITLVLAATPSRAFAYVDPNAGGMLFQLLTPIAAIGAVVLSFFRRQCRDLMAKVFRRNGVTNSRNLQGKAGPKEQ